MQFFIVNNFEDVSNPAYQKIKQMFITKFQNNDFKFSDKIFKRSKKTFFEFNWIPSNINYHKVFWKFVKINFILRMIHFSNNSFDLQNFIKMNLYVFIDDMLRIENQKLVKQFHKPINVKHINNITIKKQVTIFYRNINFNFWKCYKSVKNLSFSNDYIVNMSITLMEELKINNIKSIFNNQKDHAFILSCFYCVCMNFIQWKKNQKTIGHVWNLIPFLNFLYYKKLPMDKDVLDDISFLKYIPLVEYNFKDNIFDGSDYLKKAMKECLPYTVEKQLDPIVLMLKISLPRRHIKKNAYKHIFNCYQIDDIIQYLFDSCIVNSIVGLYPNCNESNHKIYKNIKDVKLLLRFYNKFVFNPQKIEFIKMFCTNQVYFKWIIREFIIFTLKNSISIPITKKYWETNTDIHSKMSLNFPNFVFCNEKNIFNFRILYFFNQPIKEIHETTKKKKKTELEITVLNELKFSIQNDFIIKKIFNVPIKTYITEIPQEVFDKIKILIKYNHLSYSEKLNVIGLNEKDCKIIHQIEQNHINKTNFKLKQFIEQLSEKGKFLCYNFFDIQSKYKKIKFYSLSSYEKFYQMLIEAMLGRNYFEKVVYTLCCDYPRICNKAGNQNSDKNESGLHEVSIGVKNMLFCSKHNKKKNKKKNELILYLLKDCIINEIKKLFKYSNDRSLTFQLYQRVITQNPKLPEWFTNEPYDIFKRSELLQSVNLEDEKYKNGTLTRNDLVYNDIRNNTLVNFCDFTNVTPNSFENLRRTTCKLSMKNFSFPITQNPKKVKEILCKIITSNKLQLKTIINKRLKFLLDNVVTDTSTITRNLIGEFIVIESKKKSKKKNKKKSSEKKNNVYQRVFRLCKNCGELKLYNTQSINLNNYLCCDCFVEKRKNVNVDIVYLNFDNLIPLSM